MSIAREPTRQRRRTKGPLFSCLLLVSIHAAGEPSEPELPHDVQEIEQDRPCLSGFTRDTAQVQRDRRHLNFAERTAARLYGEHTNYMIYERLAGNCVTALSASLAGAPMICARLLQ
jgi:hypothetical protein